MYKLVYWLENQSKLFSEPRYYETYNKREFLKAFEIAEREGYEVEYATEV